MSNIPKVIIAGAGPTGLVLAAELAGAGIPCRVLERRPQRSPWSRAFGLTPFTMELLDMRGEATAMIAKGQPCAHGPLGDGKNHIDFGSLDSRFPFMLIIPQNRTEEMLEDWALRSGAELIREAQVTGLEQDDSGVTVQVQGPGGTWTERASFVVGCDGVRSAVRSLIGMQFRGSSYDCSLMTADVRLKFPPPQQVDARTSARGTVAVFPFGDGTFRLVVLDRKRMQVPAEQPVTLEEIQDSVKELLGGTDLGIHDPKWLSRFRSDQRQADHYRVGRVLLAGDAAHTHIPSGGQGLQVGVQDAFNLGWKLIAELKGWAPPGLLDSYEHERHPVAAATLRKTDLMFKYEVSSAPPLVLARWLVMQMMRVKALQLPVVKELTGLTLRYPPKRGADAHALVGRRASDVSLDAQGLGTPRLYELLRGRQFVLIDQTPEGTFANHIGDSWGERVVVARGKATDRKDLPVALLVRPDGMVAWAPTATGAEGLMKTLRQWCGAPAARDTALPAALLAARA